MNVVVPIKPGPNVVSVAHRIVAYDRNTDRVAFELDVPEFLDSLVQKVAEIETDDPTAAFSYVLGDRQVTAFSFLLGLSVESDRHEYFLEPSDTPTHSPSDRKASAIAEFERMLSRASRANLKARTFLQSELTIPTLRILEDTASKWVTTSELVVRLTDLFTPTGADAAILSGRTDTYFSQKVRNMISHRESGTSFIKNGLAEYSGTKHALRITKLGVDLIRGLRD